MLTASGNWQLYGDTDSDVLVAGHSHAYALLAGRQGAIAAGLRTSVLYTAEGRSGPPGDAEYWTAVSEWSRGRVLALVWNGNQHNADFLLQAPIPFRIHRPGIDASADPGVWVPESMLRARWEPTVAEALPLISELAARGTRVLVVGTPPPKTPAFIRARLSSEPHFVAVAQQLGFDLTTAAITAGPTRRSMWGLIQDLLAEFAVRGGAEFIPVPESALDSDGYLAPAYEGVDVTHANEAYGALMWSSIAAHLDPRNVP